MERRAFVTGIVALLAAPLAIGAQSAAKIPRIGVLVTGPPPGEHACVIALRQGLADLGYVDGRTHALEIRWAEEQPEKSFPALGAELVRLGVDLIVSVTSQGLVEAKSAIASVPVVMAASNYPVERHLVASYSHPGGNITGLATFTGEMFAKRVQLLAETLPPRGARGGTTAENRHYVDYPPKPCILTGGRVRTTLLCAPRCCRPHRSCPGTKELC